MEPLNGVTVDVSVPFSSSVSTSSDVANVYCVPGTTDATCAGRMYVPLAITTDEICTESAPYTAYLNSVPCVKFTAASATSLIHTTGVVSFVLMHMMFMKMCGVVTLSPVIHISTGITPEFSSSGKSVEYSVKDVGMVGNASAAL